MSFGEDLTKLRKSKGLSQEEFAEKLNVTRQTVSKWELDQTTPEMGKLVEISKLFNISLDELLNNSVSNTVNENEDLNEDVNKVLDKEEAKEKIINNISNEKHNSWLVVVLVIFLIIIGGKILYNLVIYKIIDTATNSKDSSLEIFKDTANDMSDSFLEMFESTSNEFINTTSNLNDEFIETTSNKNDTTYFFLENTYNGSITGTLLKRGLSEVIKVNNSVDNKISVVFNEINSSDENVILDLVDDINTSSEYIVSYTYNDEGIITEMNIKKGKPSDSEVYHHNFGIDNGVTSGFSLKSMLNDVISVNQTDDVKISVVFENTNTTDALEIANISKKLNNSKEYLVICSYDEYGYINVVTITKQ